MKNIGNVEKLIEQFSPDSWMLAVDFEASKKAIKNKRKAMGLTQEELAVIIGCLTGRGLSRNAISKWENEKTNDLPNHEHVYVMCRIFGCAYTDIIISIYDNEKAA